MFITVLEELIRQKGITSAKMLSDLDMNKSSVLNWKTRGTIPGGDVLIKLADYFAVQGVKLVALYVGVILLAEKHGLTVAHAVFGVCNPGLIAF